MARPSPVDSSGLVVTANSWPAPPVASRTWRARISLHRRRPGRCAATPRQRPSSTSRSSANQCSQHGDRGRSHRVDQRPLDLGAGGRAAGVDDAGQGVAALAGQLRAGPRGRGRTSAPRAMSSLTRPGPSSTRTRTASTSHRPGAGGERVGQVEVGGVGVAGEHGGHAALGPAGGGLRSSALVSTPTRSASSSAARTAADRPATPLPRTRRSSSSAPSQVIARLPVRPRPGACSVVELAQAARRPRWSKRCSQPSGDEVGSQVAQRRQHEGPLAACAGGARRGRARRPSRRRPTARRRRACAVPSARPACGWPSPRGGGTSSSSSRASSVGVQPHDHVEVRTLAVRAADRVGLVHGRDGDEVGQQRRRRPAGSATRSPRLEPRARSARVTAARLVMVTAAGGQVGRDGGRSLRTVTGRAPRCARRRQQLLGDALGHPLEQEVRLA